MVHVVEIEPQTLWTKGTGPGAEPRGNPLELRELTTLPQRTLTHGIGYPIGGTICDQQRHVDEFQCWTEKLASPWTSEHLSILHVPGAHGPEACGFLMPPPQTDAQVELAAANIRQRATTIGRPFAFETGVNYFAPQPAEMHDGDFFAAVAETADCGILLDLNNLWVNARNGRASINDVLARLPLERVWEVHLAGAEFAHGHWLDAHCGGIDPELAMIAADIVADLPNLGAIIFEISPDRVSRFGAAAFLREMETLHRLWAKTRPGPTASTVTQRASTADATKPTPQAWELLIADRMLPANHRPVMCQEQLVSVAHWADPTDGHIKPGHDGTRMVSIRASDERAFKLYAELAQEFRFGAIADLFKYSIRLLLIALGEPTVRDLLDRYTAIVPPTAFPSDEALNFGRFVAAQRLPVPGFADILLFESASVEAAADGCTVQITLKRDIGALLDDIASNRIPAPMIDDQAFALEVGVDPQPFVRLIKFEFNILNPSLIETPRAPS